jgi:hypothetical protein
MKLSPLQLTLGLVGLGIMIFWAFNEIVRNTQKQYILGEIERIREEFKSRINNPTSRLSSDETIALAKQLKTLRQYQNNI